MVLRNTRRVDPALVSVQPYALDVRPVPLALAPVLPQSDLYWNRKDQFRIGLGALKLDVSMTILLTIIHILVCFFLVVVVLLQSGKAADLAGAFGGMGSQTAFGPRGSATVLSKATTIAASLFMLTSLSLAVLATRNAATSGSVLEHQKRPAKTVPAPTPAKPSNQIPITVTPPGGGKPIPVPVNPVSPPAQQPSAPKK
jgi:preprotein translocase subunit SecG